MAKKNTVALDEAGAVTDAPMTRHDAAHHDHENNPRYWVFRKSTGLYWVLATGQIEARKLAGDVMPKFVAMYANAGQALRFMEQTSFRTNEAILNLIALEAAAKMDPEQESLRKAHWEAKKAGLKK